MTIGSSFHDKQLHPDRCSVPSGEGGHAAQISNRSWLLPVVPALLDQRHRSLSASSRFFLSGQCRLASGTVALAAHLSFQLTATCRYIKKGGDANNISPSGFPRCVHDLDPPLHGKDGKYSRRGFRDTGRPESLRQDFLHNHAQD